MKNYVRVSLACALISATAAFAVGAYQGLNLHWTPKEGDSANYLLTGSLQVGQQVAEMKSKYSLKVLKVDSDGSYSLQTNGSDGSVTIGGQEAPIQQSLTITHYKPNGDVIDVTGDNVVPDSYRFASLSNLRRPDKPVNIGDVWTIDIKTDAKVTVPVKGSFKLDLEEKIGTVDTYKIVGSLKEVEGATPGEIDSTYWISKSDFSMVKYIAKWINVPAPGVGPLSGTMTMVRVESPPAGVAGTTTGGG